MEILLMLFHPGDLIGDWSLAWLVFVLAAIGVLMALFLGFFIYTIVWIVKRFDKEKKEKSLKNSPFS